MPAAAIRQVAVVVAALLSAVTTSYLETSPLRSALVVLSIPNRAVTTAETVRFLVRRLLVAVLVVATVAPPLNIKMVRMVAAAAALAMSTAPKPAVQARKVVTAARSQVDTSATLAVVAVERVRQVLPAAAVPAPEAPDHFPLFPVRQLTMRVVVAAPIKAIGHSVAAVVVATALRAAQALRVQLIVAVVVVVLVLLVIWVVLGALEYASSVIRLAPSMRPAVRSQPPARTRFIRSPPRVHLPLV